MSIEVSITECKSYDREKVKQAVIECLNNIGGLENIIKKNSKVLLKPNLVMSAKSEQAVTTHPEIIRAIGELLNDLGADIYLGDSPGLGSAKKVSASCGIEEVAKDLNIKIIEFTEGNKKQDSNNIRLGIEDMAKEIDEMDFRINLPKYKTHMFSTLSLSVKNCFGTIVGAKKFQWHYRAGHDESMFSRMLLDICDTFNPSLNIMDAVVGMDGNGPTSGKTKEMGFIAASKHAIALDKVCAEIAGLTIQEMGILKEAAKRNYDFDWINPVIKGVQINDVKPESIKLPETQPYNKMMPLFLKNIVRKIFTSEPVVDKSKCIKCGICKNVCPAQVISLDNSYPEIDANGCIRCYCCHELCPHGAMDISRSFASRVRNIFSRKNK